MSEPMSAEQLDELVDVDPLRLRDEAVNLLAEVERLREEERRQRETVEAASRGWRIEVAEVERLRAALAFAKDHAAQWQTVNEQVEAERDRLAEQVQRVKLVRVWRNEDGKGFVFADDLRRALDGAEAGS